MDRRSFFGSVAALAVASLPASHNIAFGKRVLVVDDGKVHELRGHYDEVRLIHGSITFARMPVSIAGFRATNEWCKAHRGSTVKGLFNAT